MLPRIAIIGLGYVGLCTGVCLASRGFKIVGVDTHAPTVEAIARGEPTLFEAGVKEHLGRAISEGRFSCSTSFETTSGSDYFFITVGTPSRRDGGIDLSQVRSAARSVGGLLTATPGFPLVVVRSTVLPGTAAKTVKPILEKASGMTCGKEFGLCSNPEFLREGSAVEDTFHPDKVVVGSEDEKSGKKLLDLYGEFFGGTLPPTVNTSLSSAELIKYANNAFLATKISYINTVARICEALPDSDVKTVAKAIGLDSRIGPRFLNAGPGYGGSCFPKDLSALLNFCESSSARSNLLEAVRQVNDTQPGRVLRLARRLLPNLKGRRVSVLGLAFKANTDDIRESPSLVVVRKLISAGAKVIVYDPRAMDNAKRVLGSRILYSKSVEDCLRGSDLCIVLTEWDDFSRLGPGDFLRLMAKPRLVDGRRIFDPQKFSGISFAAIGLGR